MSVKAMGLIWDADLPPNLKLVLQALADHADHEGRRAFPGADLLSEKTGYSKRHVKSLLKQLREKPYGIIEPENGLDGGRGLATSYRIHFDRLPKKEPEAAPSEKGEVSSPFSEKGDERDTKRVKSDAQKGDAHITPTISNHPEPSLTPGSDEPGAEPVDLHGLDPKSDRDWPRLRQHLFVPVRKHVWRGSSPSPAALRSIAMRLEPGETWDEANELSILRNWLRDGLLDPDEAIPLLEEIPKQMSWDEGGTLLWLASSEHVSRIREIVGVVQKKRPPKVGIRVEVRRAG